MSATSPQGDRAKDRTRDWKEDPEAINDLCSYVVSGGHLPGYCKERGIAYTTIRDWISANQDRSAMYARAREDRSDLLADEIVSISDEAQVEAQYDGENVTLRLDAAAIQRNRLRVEARKWVAAKLKPRTYGDKVEVGAEKLTDAINGLSGVALRFIEPAQGDSA